MDSYNFHINKYDLVFLATIFIGLTFIMLLWFTKRKNQGADRFAGLALTVIILWIARVLGTDIGLTNYFPHWSWLPMQFSFALGPLIFFYVYKILHPEDHFRFSNLLHFSPVLLELSAQAIEINESVHKGLFTYQTHAFVLLNPLLRLLALISVGIYLNKSFKIIEKFYRSIQFVEGERQRNELRWLQRMLKAFSLLWLLWLTVSAINYFSNDSIQGAFAYYPLYILLAGTAIWMAAFVFLRREISVPVKDSPLIKPAPPADLKQKGIWLRDMVIAEQYYLDPELSLNVLAEKLGLHSHELSRIINTALNKTFYDFVNECRVAEVIRKMHDPANNHITLLGIAYESGFNSKSTFNRIFKQMTGKSPIAYKKESPTYNLRRFPKFAVTILNQETTQLWTYKNLTCKQMFKNYLKTAFRSLLNNKGFTLINIFGLAIGLASFFLILFYVVDESTYDQFNTKISRIFRVNTDIKFGGNETSNATAPAPLYSAIKFDFPEVEKVVRITSTGSFQVKKGDQNFTENKVAYADSTLFSVFTLPLINGSATDALIQPHSVVITEDMAIKYFNTTDVVGKVLTFNNSDRYKVTGVIKNIPPQSHFNYDFFISMSTLPDSRQDIWLYSNFNTYVLLRQGVDYKKFELKLPDFMKKHAGPQLVSMMHISVDQFEQSGNFFKFNLTPLKDIHLHSNRVSELSPNGNIQYIYIFSAIAIFILFIACVNFMNLSTASSSKRAREVGVRKVLGSPRIFLIIQFLTESTLVTLTAALIAVTGAYFLLPFFNQLAGKELMITWQLLLWLIPLIVLMVIVIGLLAGSYPAFFLSAFQPIEVLKGKVAAGFKGGKLRSFLVVFQFSVSIFLIVGTLVIYQQLRYIQNKDLGYNRNQVLTIQNVDQLGNQAKTFKEEVKQISAVQNATLTGDLPTSAARNGVPIPLFKDSVLDPKRAIKSQVWNVDEDYIPTLDIKIVSGRNFSKQMLTDSSKMIINEAAAKLLGFADPLNQKIYEPQDNGANNLKPYRVIGVMKDFNYKSLRENVTPLIFILKENHEALSIKINTSNIPPLLQQIKNQWNKVSPGQPMVYSFMDDDFDALYRSEQRMGKIFMTFTSMAILIACLGLFALSAYAADQRTKEIGIRKVLGADISKIVFMLSVDFIKLVCIAIFISIPIAWWAMQKWLQEFAYRQSISPWLFLLAGVSAILIAVLTISFQAIKAALLNPVKSLRT